MDYYGFYIGEEFEAYKYLGAHLNADGVTFRTFAPNAVKISVIGEFNGWTETPMNKVYDGNFWECSISGAKSGDMYKYRIYKKDGTFTDRCDPYGFYAELRPDTASRVFELEKYKFKENHSLQNLCKVEHATHYFHIQNGTGIQKTRRSSCISFRPRMPIYFLQFSKITDRTECDTILLKAWNTV